VSLISNCLACAFESLDVYPATLQMFGIISNCLACAFELSSANMSKIKRVEKIFRIYLMVIQAIQSTGLK
jgi:hypothetical protein